jgi:uncharacterized protein YdcH (DUF465 family)
MKQAENLDQLREEHQALDARLHELEKHISLSPTEERERAELKKRKLFTKDRIAALMRTQR